MNKVLIKTSIAAVLGLGLTIAPALAESWHVVEGPDGKTTGVWTIEMKDGVVTGSAVMTTTDHKPLTYALSGKVVDNSWTLDRIKPSDNILCTYTGTSPVTSGLKKPTEINGSAYCQARTGLWKVRIMSAK
jgi:ABC-type transport system substrate-binding protein